MTARQPDGSIPATPPSGAARRPGRLGQPWRVAIHSTVYGTVACLALLTILRAAGWETALPPLLAITPYASTPLLLAATPYVGILGGACTIVALATKMRVAAAVTLVLLAAHLAWFVPRVSAEPRAAERSPAAWATTTPPATIAASGRCWPSAVCATPTTPEAGPGPDLADRPRLAPAGLRAA